MPIDPLKLIVGASDDADMVVREPTVSKRHCELRWTGTVWILEDLASTNGTFVDGKRIAAPTEINENTKVTLGRGVNLPLDFLRERVAAIRSPITPSANLAQEHSLSNGRNNTPAVRTNSKPWPMHAIIPLVGGMLLILASVFIFRRSGATPDEGTANARTIETTPSAPPITEGPVLKPSGTQQSSLSPEILPSAPLKSVDQSPYWGLILRAKDGKSQRLLGTAIAISPRLLLTTASLIDAAQQVREEYPFLLMQACSEKSTPIPALNIRLHPSYTAAKNKREVFERELDARLAKAAQDEVPSEEEALGWSKRWEAIVSEITVCDLAIIELPKDLPDLQPVERGDLDAQEIRKTTGVPMIIPSPFLERGPSEFFLEIAAQGVEGEKTEKSPIEIEVDLVAGISAVSMACINRSGQFVGICAKMNPEYADGVRQRCVVIPIVEFWK
jgi:pSer/pThr/pTyr-binding forkhead associated (FHA) protein